MHHQAGPNLDVRILKWPSWKLHPNGEDERIHEVDREPGGEQAEHSAPTQRFSSIWVGRALKRIGHASTNRSTPAAKAIHGPLNVRCTLAERPAEQIATTMMSDAIHPQGDGKTTALAMVQ